MPETQDILGLGFNVAEVERQKSLIVGYFKEILTGAEQFNNLKISFANLSGGIADFTRANNQLATSSDNVTKAQARVDLAIKNYDDTLKKVNATTRETNAASQQVIQAQRQLAEAVKTSNIEEQQALKTDKLREDQARRTAAALKSKSDAGTEIPFTHNLAADGSIVEPTQGATTGSIVTQVEQAQVEGILTAKEYAAAQKGVSASFVESQNNAKKYAVTQKEIDLALAQDKLNAQKRTSELKNQVREESAVKGSIEQRRAALIRLNQVYDNLSPQERNSAAGQRLQKITLGITEQLKQLEAASGRAQRNVGNYPTNSFNGLKAQLKDVTEQYSKLTAQEAKSAQGKALKSKMDEISKSIKNFGETSTVSFSKAYSGIRILANILPGLGISGIFLLAGEAIASTVVWIKEMSGKVVDFAEKMKSLSQVNLKALESFGEQRSHIEGLTAVIKDGNISLEDKSRALKDLIALDPKYLHGLTMANITTDEGKKILGDYISLLRRKAELEAAQAVQGDASKEVYKLEVIKDLLRKRLVATKTNYDDLTEEELKYVDKVKTSTGRINFTASLLNLEIPKSDIQEMLVGVDKELTKAGKKVTASMDVFKDKFKAVGDDDVKLGIVESLKKQISDIEKAIEFEPIKAKIPDLVATRKRLQEELDKLLDTKKDKKTKVVGKDFLDDIIKAQNEARKFLLESQRDLNKSIVDDDRLSYTQRLMALESYNSFVIQLMQVDKDNAIRANKEKRDNDVKETGLSLKQKAQIIVAAGIEQKNIENKYNVELQKAKLDQAKQLRDFEKNDAEKQKQTRLVSIAERQKALYDENQERIKGRLDADKHFDELAATIDATASAKEQTALLDKYAKGKISKEQYEKDLFDIQMKYTQKGLQLQISTLEDELKLANLDYDTRKDIEKKLAELRLKVGQGVLTQADKNREEIVKEIQAIQQAFNQVADVLGGAINISVVNQKNALQDLEDQQQKNYQNQIDRINSSTLTDAEKADQLKILDAQRQAQKETFDRKNREADRKKAEFDKATGIMNIILSTAIAVAKSLPNLFLAIAVGALGAAQLGIALATPIPKYAKGLKNSPTDHIGIFGEAGMERVEMPGRAPFYADKETLSFIPKGTNITPVSSNEINRIMYSGMIKQTAATIQNKPDKSEALLMELVKETRKNNGKKVQVNTRIKYDTTWETYKKSYYR
jgi:hypothetical protein